MAPFVPDLLSRLTSYVDSFNEKNGFCQSFFCTNKLTHSAAPSSVFEGRVEERGSGSTLSKLSGHETGGSRRVDIPVTCDNLTGE